MNQLVSVIIPACNEESCIEEAIKSVLSQTYSNLEIIVVDDGSTDRTSEIVTSFKNKKIKLIRQEQRGLASALNRGLQHAAGEIIVRLDADDIALPERIEKQVQFLQKNPDIALVGTLAMYEHFNGSLYVNSRPITNRQIRKYLLHDNPFVHSSVAFRREVLDTVGTYNGTYVYEDYEFWVRVAARYKVAIIPEVLVLYNVRDRSLSHQLTHSVGILKRLHVQLLASKLLGPFSLGLFYIIRSVIALVVCWILEIIKEK